MTNKEKQKRDWLIYKLRYADHASILDITERIVSRGFPRLDPSQVGRIARKMKIEVEKNRKEVK